MAKHKALIIAMLDADLTQIAVAKLTGIGETRLSRIVNGHDEPTPDEKKALARVLKTPITRLFEKVA